MQASAVICLLLACRLPKAVAYLCITSKAAYESPRAAAMTHLVLRLAEDALCETAYLADVAGLSYDVCPFTPAIVLVHPSCLLAGPLRSPSLHGTC